MSDDDAGGEGEETRPLDGLAEALALKDESRTGWVLRGVTDPESVAAHSWGVTLLTLLYADAFDDPVDRKRALALATVHDLGEAKTGDVPTRADPDAETPPDDEQHAREREAMAEFARTLDGDALPDPDVDLPALFREYETCETPEARLVHDLDKVELLVQALAYERADRYDPAAGTPDAFAAYDDLDEFFATADAAIESSLGRRLYERIHAAYERAKKDGGSERA